MDRIDKVISDYLSVPETDFAIMISGDWGSGKSYYIHHDFVDVVNSVPVPQEGNHHKKEKERNYKPAFISLYGVSSAEDFEYRVFCGINSWAERGFIRVGGTLISKGAGFLGIDIRKEDVTSWTFVNRDRVLVFDDLERICEDKMPVKEDL